MNSEVVKHLSSLRLWNLRINELLMFSERTKIAMMTNYSWIILSINVSRSSWVFLLSVKGSQRKNSFLKTNKRCVWIRDEKSQRKIRWMWGIYTFKLLVIIVHRLLERDFASVAFTHNNRGCTDIIARSTAQHVIWQLNIVYHQFSPNLLESRVVTDKTWSLGGPSPALL